MRKIILVWSTLAAMLVAAGQVSLAESRRPRRDSGASRAQATVVPVDESPVEESGLGLEFESISDDEAEEVSEEAPEETSNKILKIASKQTALGKAAADDDSDWISRKGHSPVITSGASDESDEEDSFKIFPKRKQTRLTSAQDPEPELVMSEPGQVMSDPGWADPNLGASCGVGCIPFWQHRCGVWGEYLFLRPRGADVTYASTVDGTLATSVPLGDRSVADFGYNSGFRAGVGFALDPCSSITGNYTWFRATSSDSINLPGGGGSFISAETVHPNTINVAADSLSASALNDLSLQAADLNYKGLVYGDDCTALNYLVGVKYARLEQEFAATYSILGTTNVNTDIDFSGIGPRFGYEVERQLGRCGMIGYSKGTINFLAGSCSADFLQTNVFTGVQARTDQHDSRIVTIPELEVGGGWQSCSGCFRITAGYYITAWFNMLTTPEYLSSIRTTQNTFQDQIKTLTLDGLTVRGEFRF